MNNYAIKTNIQQLFENNQFNKNKEIIFQKLLRNFFSK